MSIGVIQITLQDYWRKLIAHDWLYSFSSDSDVFKAGRKNRVLLERQAGLSPEHRQMIDEFSNFYLSLATEEETDDPLPPYPVSEDDLRVLTTLREHHQNNALSTMLFTADDTQQVASNLHDLGIIRKTTYHTYAYVETANVYFDNNNDTEGE